MIKDQGLLQPGTVAENDVLNESGPNSFEAKDFMNVDKIDNNDHDEMVFNNSVNEQVIKDLEKEIAKFQDPSKALKVLSRRLGIHEKTLKRQLNGDNIPRYLTLFKIYRYLLGTDDLNVIYDKSPAIIKEALKRGLPASTPTKGIVYKLDIEREILTDKVFREVYFKTRAGEVTREEVSYRFGQYGLDTLQKMLDIGAIESIRPGVYITGKNRPTLSVEAFQVLGVDFINTFYKPENSDQGGENLIYFYVYGLSPEAYNEWLKIDYDAYYKKLAITKDEKNKGDIKAFTFACTDTMVYKANQNVYASRQDEVLQ